MVQVLFFFFPIAFAACDKHLDVFDSIDDFRARIIFSFSFIKGKKEPISCVAANRGWSHHSRGYKTSCLEHFCQDPLGKVEGKPGKTKKDAKAIFKTTFWNAFSWAALLKAPVISSQISYPGGLVDAFASVVVDWIKYSFGHAISSRNPIEIPSGNTDSSQDKWICPSVGKKSPPKPPAHWARSHFGSALPALWPATCHCWLQMISNSPKKSDLAASLLAGEIGHIHVKQQGKKMGRLQSSLFLII